MKKKLIKIFKKIFITSLIATLLLALLLNCLTLLSLHKIKRGDFIDSGYTCAIIGSGSMEPNISINDLLIIKGNASYQENEIITYVSPRGSLVTHRVKEVLEEGYITQGDANNVADEEIPKQRVLGKVIFITPGVGAFLYWILSPVGIILLVCILLLVWLIQRIRGD